MILPGVIAARRRGPVVPTDPYWSSVKALLHFDGADGSTVMTDQTGRIWTASGNAQIDTAQKRFGTGSLLLDGSGDYISTANSADLSIADGTGDVTIEAFVRMTAGGRIQAISNKRDSTGAEEHSLALQADNTLVFVAYNGTPAALLIGTTALSVGVFYHVAATRQGTTWRLFLDGNLEASAVESGPVATNTAPLLIGRDGFNSTRDFQGHIDDYRFTKGVARYTANFTPPVAPFPNS